MLNDPLANALSKILNSERLGKDLVVVKPFSKVIRNIFRILNEKGFLGEFKEVEDGAGNYVEISLLGRINKCGAVKPRYSVKSDGFEKFERRYLPAKDFGVLLVSTNQGIMTHIDAKKKKLGGILLGYCY